MNITITKKEENYLDKKYGNAKAILQQIIDNFVVSEVDRDYEKKVKISIDKKLDKINNI